jgi:hypothetical protein
MEVFKKNFCWVWSTFQLKLNVFCQRCKEKKITIKFVSINENYSILGENERWIDSPPTWSSMKLELMIFQQWELLALT